MKSQQGKKTRKTLTLGEFVTGIYDVCGKSKANGIVRLALKTNLVELCGQPPLPMCSQFQRGTAAEKNLRELSGATASATAAQGQDNSSCHILVVDDDSGVRELSTEVLVRSGYRVDAAEDGAAGWQALNTQRYDLLITDNNMPRLSGIELVKKLRAARMALPVIMATGKLPVAELDENPALRLAAMLSKPFSTVELLETVRVVLRATDPARAPIKSTPNWRDQGPADGLRM